MAAPTLETDGSTLRIIAGSSGDPVTYNDVWDWDDGGGSSGGDGDVPVDGGGTEKVNAYLTEHVADGMYQVTKDIQFGDGSTSSYFRSSNEFVYFDADVTFDVTSAATLQMGILDNSYGISGAAWSLEMSGLFRISVGQSTATFLFYDSRLGFREQHDVQFEGGDVTVNKGTFQQLSGGTLQFMATLASLSLTELYSYGSSYGFGIHKTPSVFTGCHGHNSSYGIFAQASVTVTEPLLTNISSTEMFSTGGVTLQVVDSLSSIGVPLILNAADVHKERYTVNIHVADDDGADLESATVAATSFGNIVSNDAGSTFYRCVEDHTSGTFATDLAAGKWELTTAANAALAGVTGAAGAGAWVTGISYVKAASQFSVSTDSNGDIAEQTITVKEWHGTSEALLSFAPYSFALSKTDYETLTMENIAPSASITWSLELQDEIPTRYDVDSSQSELEAGGVPVSVTTVDLTEIPYP